MTIAITEDFAAFERALDRAETGAAVEVVERLLDAGTDPVTVLVEVIAAAQRRIGERWQRGEWSVAKEHAATGVSVAATEAVGRYARRLPVSKGRVVLGCAEREWHALPALVVAYGLRARGWDVTFLGASTPPIRLASYLDEMGPDTAAVSCSVLGALPSTRNFIEASTDTGIPVLAGGSAFGMDDRRAMALGATAWAGSLVQAIELMDTLPPVVGPVDPLPAAPLAEQRALELAHATLAAELRTRWNPGVVDPSVKKDAVNQALHALQGALLTGDPRTLSEAAWWIGELLRARQLPERELTELGMLVHDQLRDYPLASGLIREHWMEDA